MISLTTYKRPVLLVGNGARQAGAAKLIVEFAKRTNIPVLTTMNAVDLAQDDIHFGFIGTYGNRISNMIIAQCDVVISIGARLGLRQIGHTKDSFAPYAKLIRCDIDQAELSRDIKCDETKYLMDGVDFLNQLMSEDLPDFSKWHECCVKAKKLLEGYDNTQGNDVIEKISSILPENPVIAVDVGQNQCWSAQSLSLKGYEGRILIGGGYGCMGCSLPFAIGASISRDNGLTYCITGDGGLQMNIQELETVVRECLPIKIIVINNRVLGKISEIQSGSYGNRYAQTTQSSGYTVPDFVKIANAYGLRAVAIDDYRNLDMYKDWLYDDEPCLINVKIEWNTLLIPKIKWETGSILPELKGDIMSRVKSLLSENIL